MKKSTMVLIGIAAVLVLMVLTGVSQYNQLVNLEVQVSQQFAQVDSKLQRRNDLIPNLVSTVKAYAKHEDSIFKAIADARSKLIGAKTPNEKVQANNEMGSALSRLLMIVENYPNLKANEGFLKLQDQLEGAENRISVERDRYNQVVGQYNRVRRSFPTVVWGNFLGFNGSKEFFKATESAREVPKVDF